MISGIRNIQYGDRVIKNVWSSSRVYSSINLESGLVSSYSLGGDLTQDSWLDGTGSNDLVLEGAGSLEATPTALQAINLPVEGRLICENPTGLPVGSQERTMVSVVKYEEGDSFLTTGFIYGSSSPNQAFGPTRKGKEYRVIGWGSSNDQITNLNFAPNQFVVQAVVLKDNNEVEHYINGELIQTTLHTFNTVVDYLCVDGFAPGTNLSYTTTPLVWAGGRIYNRALSSEEVAALSTQLLSEVAEGQTIDPLAQVTATVELDLAVSTTLNISDSFTGGTGFISYSLDSTSLEAGLVSLEHDILTVDSDAPSGDIVITATDQDSNTANITVNVVDVEQTVDSPVLVLSEAAAISATEISVSLDVDQSVTVYWAAFDNPVQDYNAISQGIDPSTSLEVPHGNFSASLGLSTEILSGFVEGEPVYVSLFGVNSEFPSNIIITEEITPREFSVSVDVSDNIIVQIPNGVPDTALIISGATESWYNDSYLISSEDLDLTANAMVLKTADISDIGYGLGDTLDGPTALFAAEEDSHAATITYSWYRSDDEEGLNEEEVIGATSKTYTTVSGDEGKWFHRVDTLSGLAAPSVRRLISNSPWSPSQLTSLEVWFDPSDSANYTLSGGGGVDVLTDLSGNSRDAIKESTFGPELLAEHSPSGLDMIKYSAGKAMAFPHPISGAQARSLMVVQGAVSHSGLIRALISLGATGNDSSGERWNLFGDVTEEMRVEWTGGNVVFTGYSSAAAGIRGSFHDGSATATGLSVSFDGEYLTNVTTNTTNILTDNSSGGFIGKRDPDVNTQIETSIGEIVICSALLSETDRQKLEGYLAHKWGYADLLPVSHLYKSEAPTE